MSKHWESKIINGFIDTQMDQLTELREDNRKMAMEIVELKEEIERLNEVLKDTEEEFGRND